MRVCGCVSHGGSLSSLSRGGLNRDSNNGVGAFSMVPGQDSEAGVTATRGGLHVSCDPHFSFHPRPSIFWPTPLEVMDGVAQGIILLLLTHHCKCSNLRTPILQSSNTGPVVTSSSPPCLWKVGPIASRFTAHFMPSLRAIFRGPNHFRRPDSQVNTMFSLARSSSSPLVR